MPSQQAVACQWLFYKNLDSSYLEPDLQQRELLQIFTAFPFNLLLHKNMQTEPLREQKYILFFYSDIFLHQFYSILNQIVIITKSNNNFGLMKGIGIPKAKFTKIGLSEICIDISTYIEIIFWHFIRVNQVKIKSHSTHKMLF